MPQAFAGHITPFLKLMPLTPLHARIDGPASALGLDPSNACHHLAAQSDALSR
jgi:hypothetical protein